MPSWYRPRMLRTDKQPLSVESQALIAEFDNLIDDCHTASKLSLGSLRQPLSRVPRSERGVEWTERVVLAYCVKRQRSSRVRSLIKSISAYWNASGQEPKALEFQQRVRDILISGNTGDVNYFVDFSSKESGTAADELNELVSLLQSCGLEVFVNSGTLLGAVREKDFLKHDDDMDLGVIMKASDEGEVAKEMISLHQTLCTAIDLPVKLFHDSPILKIKLKSQIVVDLFPTWERAGKVYVWPHTYGELSRSCLLPLRPVIISGREFPAPAEPEKMLALNYGENWHTPDPHFVFPWQQARENFRKLLRSYWYAVRIYAVRRKLLRKF